MYCKSQWVFEKNTKIFEGIGAIPSEAAQGDCGGNDIILIS
jgi:hypothetical protein